MNRSFRSALFVAASMCVGSIFAQTPVKWRFADLGAFQNVLNLGAPEMGLLKDVEARYNELRSALPATLDGDARDAELNRLMAERDAALVATLDPAKRAAWHDHLRSLGE